QGSTNSGTNTAMIAVTILTSLTEEMLCQDLSMNGSVSGHAKKLAAMAHESGADGVVCSAHEVPDIKQVCGEKFIAVTPGIRLSSTSHQDQKRVATPAYARESKADMLVIGRSITMSENPLKAYHQAKEEWENAKI